MDFCHSVHSGCFPSLLPARNNRRNSLFFPHSHEQRKLFPSPQLLTQAVPPPPAVLPVVMHANSRDEGASSEPRGLTDFAVRREREKNLFGSQEIGSGERHSGLPDSAEGEEEAARKHIYIFKHIFKKGRLFFFFSPLLLLLSPQMQAVVVFCAGKFLTECHVRSSHDVLPGVLFRVTLSPPAVKSVACSRSHPMP